VIARLKELVGVENAATESNEARRMTASAAMADRLFVALIIVNSLCNDNNELDNLESFLLK
jgi:hypothetical protein